MTVDGVSWGSDTSQSPALPALSLGTTIRRAPPRQDTNTAADWKIAPRVCATNTPQEANQTPSTVDTFVFQETSDTL